MRLRWCMTTILLSGVEVRHGEQREKATMILKLWTPMILAEAQKAGQSDYV